MKQSDVQPIIDAIGRLASTPQDRMWEHISIIAVVLTLCVLIWYTIETYLLRKAAQKQVTETDRLLVEAQKQNQTAQEQLIETQRQIELSLTPIVIFDSKPHVDRPTMVIRNFGSGPAFNISIEASADTHRLTFDTPPNLNSRDSLPASIIVDWETPEQYSISSLNELTRAFRTNVLPERIPCRITYESAHKRRFETDFIIEYNPNSESIFIVFDKSKELDN